jgi:hypothetical protein
MTASEILTSPTLVALVLENTMPFAGYCKKANKTAQTTYIHESFW